VETGNELAEGTILGGDFSIVRPLGSGGMGAVYVALQKSTSKLRALKVMHRDVAPNEEMQRRFEQEARVGSQIKSGHVVEVVAAGHDGPTGHSYLVMELLEGMDLASHLRKHGSLLLFEVVRIFEQLCHGVAAAHAASIVHRDLKPENIFLARSHQAGGAAAIVKILDFGIAKFVSERNTHATSAIGSPMWMAPEQTEPGPITPAADVWALGLIAYTLLTGQFFWKAARTSTGTPMYLLREIVLEPIPAASERAGMLIPPGFDAWFARCVARDPRERFADASLAWRAMQEIAVGQHPGSGQPVSTQSVSGRPVSFGPEAMAATSAVDAPSASGSPTGPLVPAGASQGVAPPTSVARSGSPWSKVSIGLAILVALLVGRSLSGKPETVVALPPVSAPAVMPVAVAPRPPPPRPPPGRPRAPPPRPPRRPPPPPPPPPRPSRPRSRHAHLQA